MSAAFTLSVVGAGAVRCVYLNDYRIVGSKPYASEELPFRDFKVTLADLENAIPAIRRTPQEAAAPELYEALDELTALMRDVVEGNYKPDSFTVQPAERALAKARGEQ